MSASQSTRAFGPTGVAPSSFVERVRSRIGTPYRMTGEWVIADPAPQALRAGELVAWAASRVHSPIPLATDAVDLHWQCVDAATPIELSTAAAIEGALVFRFATTTRSATPPREASARRSVVTAIVAVVTGEGDTITVDLSAGVHRSPTARLAATHAALVPGLDYPPEVAALAGRTDPAERETRGFRLRGDLPWLREGVRGTIVAQAQALLIAAGSAEQSRIGPTGTFDRATAHAVSAFQHRVRTERGASVVTDGSIGPATWGWLYLYADRDASTP